MDARRREPDDTRDELTVKSADESCPNLQLGLTDRHHPVRTFRLRLSTKSDQAYASRVNAVSHDLRNRPNTIVYEFGLRNNRCDVSC